MGVYGVTEVNVEHYFIRTNVAFGNKMSFTLAYYSRSPTAVLWHVWWCVWWQCSTASDLEPVENCWHDNDNYYNRVFALSCGIQKFLPHNADMFSKKVNYQ